jgi:hypothetical protein
MESQSSQLLLGTSSMNGANGTGPDTSPMKVDDFTAQFTAPVKPATAAPGGESSESPLEDREDPVVREEESAGPSMFRPEQEVEEEDEKIRLIRKWSKEEREEMAANLEMALNFRSVVFAELGGWISGNDPEQYELSEKEMNRLAKVYAPIMRKHGGKIPDGVWIALTEILILGKFTRTVLADRKENKKIAQVVASGKPQAAAQAAAAVRPVERKNYSLASDGCYLNDAVTNKRLRAELRQKQAKPSIDDLEKILEDNSEEVVRALYPQWFGANATA